MTFDELEQGFARLYTIKPDWDSYGAEPPNELALKNLRTVVEATKARGLEATRIMPSAENGAGIVWMGTFNKGNYAHIECTNDGGVAAVTSDPAACDDDHIRVWLVSDLNQDDPELPEPYALRLTLAETLEAIRTFLWADYRHT
jgi:hypothetical protein